MPKLNLLGTASRLQAPLMLAAVVSMCAASVGENVGRNSSRRTFK